MTIYTSVEHCAGLDVLEHCPEIVAMLLGELDVAATAHLEEFVNRAGRSIPAHEVRPDQFVRYLRSIRVAPNGHPSAARRRLRDKG